MWLVELESPFTVSRCFIYDLCSGHFCSQSRTSESRLHICLTYVICVHSVHTVLFFRCTATNAFPVSSKTMHSAEVHSSNIYVTPDNKVTGASKIVENQNSSRSDVNLVI